MATTSCAINRREAGIRFPIFLTRSVHDAYATVPQGMNGQDGPQSPADASRWEELMMAVGTGNIKRR